MKYTLNHKMAVRECLKRKNVMWIGIDLWNICILAKRANQYSSKPLCWCVFWPQGFICFTDICLNRTTSSFTFALQIWFINQYQINQRWLKDFLHIFSVIDAINTSKKMLTWTWKWVLNLLHYCQVYKPLYNSDSNLTFTMITFKYHTNII